MKFSGTSTMHASVAPLKHVVGAAKDRGTRFLQYLGYRSSAALPPTRTPMARSALEALQRCAVSLAASAASGQRRQSDRERLQDLLDEYEEGRRILIRRVETGRAASAVKSRASPEARSVSSR